MTVIKKRECLEVIATELKSLQREEVKKVQDNIVQLLISQQTTHSGGKLLMRSIVKCICTIFENGDYNQLNGTFVTPMLQAIQESKGNQEERLAKIYILSKVFLTIKQSSFLGNPPTKELIEAFVKVGNKSNFMTLYLESNQQLTHGKCHKII